MEQSLGLYLLIFVLFSVFFPVMWFGVIWFISHLGDWSRLAKNFSAGARQPYGTRHEGVLGWIGIASYKFTLIVHVADDGLFLETGKFFKFAHPRLFIPWNAVSERFKKSFFGRDVSWLLVGKPRIGKIGLVLELPGQVQ